MQNNLQIIFFYANNIFNFNLLLFSLFMYFFTTLICCRLYKQPVTKSNRGIILNAVEYCVFPGVVNREAKKRVLEEINRSEARHFLVLFRDTGHQFRALYLYSPETEEVAKLYGTGPRIVTDRMFDRFFK